MRYNDHDASPEPNAQNNDDHIVSSAAIS